ncbi:MAG: type IV pilin N-terminal domain-containing protein [Methanomassiliicoccales archaeon]|nr:type IV pilin N-terminal domain-containing protein [Methanomassiliicoccales archaeon]
MKKMWKTRRKTEAVSPVIATILMVAITVVLAAVLYVMVMGFNTGGNTPTIGLTKDPGSAANSYRVSILTVSSTTIKSTDLTIIVTPSGTTQSAWHVTGTTLGAGDYFYVNSTVAGTTYSVVLKYNPTNNQAGSISITAS